MKTHFLILLSFLIGLWLEISAQSTVEVEINGTTKIFHALDAHYDPFLVGQITASLIEVEDNSTYSEIQQDESGSTTDGCTALVNDVMDKIALVDRGSCAFITKSFNAQDAGAVAVIVCNNSDVPLLMGGIDNNNDLTIPSIGLSQSQCQEIRAAGVTNATIRGADNTLCARAKPIELGIQRVDSIYQPSPYIERLTGFTSETDANITASAWYVYQPTQDGLLTISSCGGGADTRLLIHWGGCSTTSIDNLRLQAFSDDDCSVDSDQPNEAPYASVAQRYVQAYEKYYIEWNNRWMSPREGFDFELNFEPIAFDPNTGETSCMALPVEPDVYTIERIEGYGAVDVNGIGAQWYTFTPTERQQLTISSCRGSTTTPNTKVNLYQHACNLLRLQASSDDDCDQDKSKIESIAVNAGLQYFIEWSDIHSDKGFEWEFFLEPIPDVEVTFTVNMRGQEIAPEGVFINGKFTDDIDVPLNQLNEHLWTISLTMPAYSTYDYFFKNGTESEIGQLSPNCTMITGGGTRLLQVPSNEDVDTGAVCFKECSSTTCEPLAISALHFTAELVAHTARLNWSVTTENEMDSFQIERKTESDDWEVIATIQTTGNNAYEYTDILPTVLSTTDYFYQIRLMSNGKSLSLSELSHLRVNNKKSQIHLFPNPTDALATLHFPTGISQIELLNVAGVQLNSYLIEKDQQHLQLNVQELPIGIYWVVIHAERITEVKKLVVL